jgi:uncharacterized protein YhdP
MPDADASGRPAWFAHHAGGIGRAFAMVLVVAWILFASLVIVLRYVVLPNVDRYRGDIEQMASRASGETVRIGAIDASWRGLRPSLELRALQVLDPNGGNVFELPSVRATLSWDSLLVFELRLSAIELDAPNLTIRRDAEGQLFIAGLPIRKKASPDNKVGEWLLAQNEIRIRNARLVWRDELREAGEAIPEDLVMSQVDFALRRSGWTHRVALRATPPSSLAAPIELRAVIDHALFSTRFADPADWRGTVYANVGSGDVVAWRAWLPLPDTLDAGRGRARVWLQFTRAGDPAGSFAQRIAERTGRPALAGLDRIAAITADLALDDVAVRWGTMKYAALASIDGRVAASQSKSEERFSATHMALQPRGGNLVPPTDFAVRRTVGRTIADEAGSASLGAIDIGVSLGLVPDTLVPPAIAEKFAALRPRGILQHMDLKWTGPIAAPRTFGIEAAFDRLALAAQPPTAEAIRIASHEVVGLDGVAHLPHQAFGQPGFENLACTLSATRTVDPKSGSQPGPKPVTRVDVKIRGEDSTITTPGLFDDPVLRLAKLKADVGVRIDGSDVEVTVRDAALENPDLAGTFDATWRHGPNSGGVGDDGGRGWIDLDAHLTRADVARVPRYLPNLISDKARTYLFKSLLAGQVTDATFRLHGPLEKLNLHTMPGAIATQNPVSVSDALIAIRDTSATKASALPAQAKDADAAIFRAVIKVKGATMLYGPARDPDKTAAAASTAASTTPPIAPSIAWPAFEDLDADIVFDQAHMTVLGHSTRVYGYRLTDLKVDLPALADPRHVLRVVGKGSGPLQDLLRFINNSPVSRWTKQFTAASQGSSDALLALALDLPLGHARDAEVAGSLQLANNDLVLNALIPPLKRLKGRIDFSDRGLTIDGLTGTSLGGPVRIDASTGRNGYIDLGVDGTLDVAALKASMHDDAAVDAASPLPAIVDRAAPFVSGNARYNVAVRVRSKRMAELVNEGRDASAPAAEPAKPDIVVQSDLVGLAIALPAPLAKNAGENWPLRVAITRSGDAAAGNDREDIRIVLADRIQADIARQRNPQGVLTPTRAAYSIGSAIGSNTAASDAPSAVAISVPTLDLDAWRDVGRQIAASAKPAGTPSTTNAGLDSLQPGRITLKSEMLHVIGRDFTRVEIDAERLASGWQADVVADQLAGRLSYTDVNGSVAARSGVAPVSSSLLVARLSRLTIPQGEAGLTHGEDALDASRQKDFPAIDMVVDRFELRGRSLGRLEVVAENTGEGSAREWKLEKLGLTMPEARFSAKGVWGHANEVGDMREHTHLDYEIEASDVGALMDRFGLTRTIKNGTAKLSGDAAWTGSPASIDFETLQGKLTLAADKGQFLKADPGIAKLLNILSLQGLARRLTLDFNDVFDAGFAFDTVRADAKIDKGIATTEDFQMRGVQATVSMSGSADLAHDTTDLHVLVKPDINAGAASLGVAVVNPVLGLATFAAQYLFKDKISQALSFEYNVRGPWGKPEVTKIDSKGHATPVVPRKTTATRDEPARAP